MTVSISFMRIFTTDGMCKLGLQKPKVCRVFTGTWEGSVGPASQASTLVFRISCMVFSWSSTSYKEKACLVRFFFVACIT